MLERGGEDYLTLEGSEVGEVVSLTIAAQGKGLNPDWLPESVTLESPLLAAPVTFDFAPGEWLLFGQPITKTPG